MPSLKHTQKKQAVEKLIIFMNFYPAPLFMYCWLGGNIGDYKADVLYFLNF